MRIAIMGTGALGCLFAAHLAGHADVWVLGTWREGVDAIRHQGICVHENGRIWSASVNATADPALAPAADIALVLVKSYQTQRAAEWAARVLAPGGLAVTLQNGLDNVARLSAVLGSDRTVAGTTFEGSTLLGPGEVRHAGRGRTHIASDTATEARVDGLISVLIAAGFQVAATDDIETMLWEKALVNASINPLTALWRIPNGGLLATPERRQLLGDIAAEAASVAAARGLKVSRSEVVERVEAVCRATAGNRSSMLQDVERGRPTEIDSINGVIVAEGERLGVPTPLNRAIWRLVRGVDAPPPLS